MDIEHLTMGDKRRLDRNHLVCATRYANLSDTLFEYLKDHQCFPHLSQVKPKRNFIVNNMQENALKARTLSILKTSI